MGDRREHRISVWMSAREYGNVAEKAGKAGIPMAEYLRRSAAGVRIREAPDADLPVLILEMRKSAEGLERLLKYAVNGGLPVADDLAKAVAENRAAERKIAEAYGF